MSLPLSARMQTYSQIRPFSDYTDDYYICIVVTECNLFDLCRPLSGLARLPLHFCFQFSKAKAKASGSVERFANFPSLALSHTGNVIRSVLETALWSIPNIPFVCCGFELGTSHQPLVPNWILLIWYTFGGRSSWWPVVGGFLITTSCVCTFLFM